MRWSEKAALRDLSEVREQVLHLEPISTKTLRQECTCLVQGASDVSVVRSGGGEERK